MKCPRCQAENPPGMRFCGQCAAPLAAICAACGSANPPGNKFCGQCAASLDKSVEPKLSAPRAYTPKHLAEKILASKTALEGERKQVTVLFADLKGSMELLADRDPEEARNILDPVLERMMEAVHRYEGTVNQVMGDGIMALFGAPLAHEDHAVRACYAALRMQESVKRYAEKARRTHGVNVRIRVGLNSGEVVVRTIGSDLHMDYTAVGQTTHLAARMEQLTDPGTVLLTPATLVLAEDFIQVRPQGRTPVKGLSDPLEIYELVGANPVHSRFHAHAARGLAKFVGRTSELAQLVEPLDLARAGRGQVVAVVGEPGVGKSRLFWEFVHSHRTDGCLVLEAASVSYGKATTYLPVSELLRGYFQIEPRDDVRKVREKLVGKLFSLDRALEPALPPLLALLDVPSDDDVEWARLEPPQRRQRTLECVKRLLLRESQVQPLVLIFEDLHWIDSETQAVLEALVESLPTSRLLLLINYRPEYQHAWGSKTYYRQLRIDALSAASAEELLTTLLGMDSSLEKLKKLLIARTEGNPFFLEESVRTLVEMKTLTGEAGAYRLASAPQSLQIPATAQAILAARIDRLEPEDKRLLQAASVVGKDVSFPLLEAIADVSDQELRRQLARLQGSEFLYETRLFPELEYTFKHALTHEVTYGTLLQERRTALHARIVGAIERFYPDRLTEHVEALAHHAVRGAIWERAGRYLRQAGEKAVARSANREAITLFEQALTALEQLPESPETLGEALDIRIALGPCLGTIHGHGAAEKEASYVAARDLCLRLDNRRRLVPALWGLWHVSFNRGLHREARDLGEELLSLAKELGDPVFLLEAHHSLWTTLYGSGDLEAAEFHVQEGLSQYDPERHRADASIYGGHDTGVCCLNFAAVIAWTRGYPDRALRYSQEAVRLARQLSHPTSAAIAHYYAAVVHQWRREHHETVAHAEAALDTARTHGLLTARYALLARLGRDEALEESELAHLHEMARPPWWAWHHTFAFCVIAQAFARAGLPDRGLAVLAEIPDQSLETVYSSEVYRCRGQLLLKHGHAQAPEVENCFRTAVELARRRGHRSLELRAATSLSRLVQTRGKREDARHMLAPIYSWFTEGFDTADLRDAKALLDELSAASK